MLPNWIIIAAQPLNGQQFQVEFADGTRHRFTLAPAFFRGVFARLRDPQEFARLTVDRDTVCWGDDLDLAPDRLYAQARAGVTILS